MAMLVADVARQLRTTPTTVRRWSSEFAEALHAPARGGHNAVRRFDGHDMQVLDRAGRTAGSNRCNLRPSKDYASRRVRRPTYTSTTTG